MKRISSYLIYGVAALLLVGAMYTLSMMKKPLGPALVLDVPPTQPPVAGAAQPVVAQPQGKKTCGNTGQMSLLVIGQGLIENGNVYRTGAIRLVVVDFDKPAVSVLAMPGELWVDAKVLKDEATPSTKLDLIYNTVYTQKPQQPEDVAHTKGTQAVAQAIIDNFGFVPDHYVTVLQQPFVELVDTLGGIDVDLPAKLEPTVESYGTYEAGPQHLDGLRTLNLTRADPKQVGGYDLWGRFDRQNIVLKGLLAAVLQPANVLKAPELIKDARKMILTDLSVDQANDLYCMLKTVGDQANMLEVHQSMITIDGENHYNPDFAAIKTLIQSMYGE